MRIIAGRWRGRRLTVPGGVRLRPTTDRLREAAFSLLGATVDGAEVVDLCCGSGGLGLEALSRGAARVHFVDIDPQALKITGQNLARCGATPDEGRLHRADALAWLGRWRRWRGAQPLVVLADPPYGHELAGRLTLALTDLPDEAGLVAALLEQARDDDPPADRPDPGPPGNWRDRHYGRSTLSLLEVRHET